MDSYYNAASQGADGSSPFRAFQASDKFGPAFLAAKGQSFGDSGAKCRSRYSPQECPSLDGSGQAPGPAAPPPAFSKYPQPQQQPPHLYMQRGPCKTPPESSLKLQESGSHNGALQVSCYGECGPRDGAGPKKGSRGRGGSGSGRGYPSPHFAVVLRLAPGREEAEARGNSGKWKRKAVRRAAPCRMPPRDGCAGTELGANVSALCPRRRPVPLPRTLLPDAAVSRPEPWGRSPRVSRELSGGGELCPGGRGAEKQERKK